MIQKPHISICIPTRDRSTFLKKGVSSVLSQTYENFEVIIVDNRSSDDTELTVQSFKDSRIRYYRNRKNIGLAANLNMCINLACGEYVSIFHDDDIMCPSNIEKKVLLLAKNKNVGFVHSNILRIDEKGDIIGKHWAKRHKKDFIIQGKIYLRQFLKDRMPVCAPSVIVRKECYQNCGQFNTALDYSCDWEMWMKILFHYDAAYINEPFICYRCHKGMTTESYLRTRGLYQIYKAKRSFLTQYESKMKHYARFGRYVNKFYQNKAFKLAERYFIKGNFKEAIKSFLMGITVYLTSRKSAR